MFLVTGGGERSSLKIERVAKRGHASDFEFFSLVISNKLSQLIGV